MHEKSTENSQQFRVENHQQMERRNGSVESYFFGNRKRDLRELVVAH